MKIDGVKIKGELLHVLRPHRTKFQWAIVYVVLVVAVLSGLFAVASHIKTHTLAIGGVQLGTSYSKYVVGEAVTFTLTNNYNAPISITNQCPGEPLAVYRQEAGVWVRIHDTASLKDCSSEQRQVSLPASSTVTSSLAPWHHLFAQPGKYRLVATVNDYTSLPYVDFEVIVPPVVAQSLTVATVAPAQPQVKVKSIQTQVAAQPAVQVQPQHTTPTPAPPQAPIPVPPVKPVAKTVTLTVNSSGNYSTTSIVLNSGDSIQFIYTNPNDNGVRTRFTPVAPTATSLSSVTLDSGTTTQTVTYNITGTWTFKVSNHNGNTGTLTVN